MAGLTAEERALVVLHELEDYGVAEIARIWGAKEGTIKSRLSRARDKMRQTISRSRTAGQTVTESGGKVYYAMQPNQTTAE